VSIKEGLTIELFFSEVDCQQSWHSGFHLKLRHALLSKEPLAKGQTSVQPSGELFSWFISSAVAMWLEVVYLPRSIDFLPCTIAFLVPPTILTGNALCVEYYFLSRTNMSHGYTKPTEQFFPPTRQLNLFRGRSATAQPTWSWFGDRRGWSVRQAEIIILFCYNTEIITKFILFSSKYNFISFWTCL
jgi:hypothetical protein